MEGIDTLFGLWVLRGVDGTVGTPANKACARETMRPVAALRFLGRLSIGVACMLTMPVTASYCWASVIRPHCLKHMLAHVCGVSTSFRETHA